MKFNITAEEFEKLEENMQALYEKQGDGYQLKVEGMPQPEDVSGLKAKISELMGETKSEREKRQALEQEQQRIEEERQKEKGEFKELYEKTQAELEKERRDAATFKQTIQEKERESLASSIAAKLTTDEKRAKILKQEAMAAIKYDPEKGAYIEVGGVPVDKDKLVSQMREEYPFLVDAPGASGGGAGGSGTGGGATKKFNEYTGAELVELKRKDPDTYQRIRDDYYNER
jgi:DNA repair exonuclease SbcCD ATPase subunit